MGTPTVFTLTACCVETLEHIPNVLRALDNECHPSSDLRRRMVTEGDPEANINRDLSFRDASVTSQTSLTSTSNNT